MIYAILGEVEMSTPTQQTAMQTFLNGVIGPETMWGTEPKNATTDTGRSPNAILVRHRYLTASDRDRIWLTLVGQIGARGALPGSYIQKHDCTHDGSGVCVTGIRQTF